MADLGADDHKQMYKNAGKAEQESSRRRRTEVTVQLRREKRGNELNKRRNIDENAEYESEVSDYEKDKPAFTCSIAEARKMLTNNPTIDDLRNVFSFLRRQLSKTGNVPINEIVQEGLVQAMVQALGVDDFKVKYEAAWGLTNVVSGDSSYTQAAVNAGATQALIKAALTGDHALAEQCFWGLANIIGDSAQMRDHAVECGFLDIFNKVVGLHLKELKISFCRNLGWICSNLARHQKSQLSNKHIVSFLPSLRKLLEFDDSATNQDACWALSYLTSGPEELLDMVYDAKILPPVLAMLRKTAQEIITPAIRVFGNFTSGTNDKHTQCIVDSGVVANEMPRILKIGQPKVVKEAIWMISNILAGTVPQIQAVIDANILPAVLLYLRQGDFRIQSECAWSISNLCHSGEVQQIYYLATLNVFEFIVPLLNVRNVDFITHIISVVKKVFHAISVMHPELLDGYKQAFEEVGGIDFIEELQNHENVAIYEACFDLIQAYFLDDEEEENATPCPSKAGDDDIAVNQPVFHF